MEVLKLFNLIIRVLEEAVFTLNNVEELFIFIGNSNIPEIQVQEGNLGFLKSISENGFLTNRITEVTKPNL